MKRFLTLIITVLLFVIAVVLGLKNQQVINVNYLVAQSEIRLATLLALVFLLGFLVSSTVYVAFYLKLKMKNRQLRKINSKQRKELNHSGVASALQKD